MIPVIKLLYHITSYFIYVNYIIKLLIVGITVEISSALQAARKSPLADEIFKIAGIRSILLGPNFLTVTKGNEVSWPQINPQIYAAIMDFFTTGKSVMNETEMDNLTDKTDLDSDKPIDGTTEIVKMIKEILDTRIRPTIQDDGGDVEFRNFNPKTGWVSLKLVGACRTCSSSTLTLRNGIENMLMHYIPEVKGVERVDENENEEASAEFEKFEFELNKTKGKIPDGL